VSKPDSWQVYQSLIDLCTSANFIEFYSRNLNILQGIDSYFDPDYGFIEYLLDAQMKSYKDTISHRHSNRLPAMDKEISSILKKLYELFTRYEKQKEDSESSMLFAFGS